MEEKKDFAKMKKEVEEKYLRIGNEIGAVQNQLNALVVEKTRLEGKFQLLEELEKNG